MTGPEHSNRFVVDYHTDPTSGMPWNTKVQTASGWIEASAS